ncbi:hypothetical protein DV38_08330 [Leptospira interrogans]|uniref:Transposase IS4 family protein n=1 Tax=Leptospira interrogans serovar Hebdomadis TaxID=211881 RepID=D4HT64_LEPIR|nr:transposase IS4 family protein [Leptospira interrogans serovar Hebdomadis]OQM31007.1 hypothetical protein DV38_08330 [Leptospira interrogans]
MKDNLSYPSKGIPFDRPICCSGIAGLTLLISLSRQTQDDLGLLRPFYGSFLTMDGIFSTGSLRSISLTDRFPLATLQNGILYRINRVIPFSLDNTYIILFFVFSFKYFIEVS